MHRRSGGYAEEKEFGPFDADRVAAEPAPKRVRARLSDDWILDTDRALLAWVEGRTPDYAIPFADLDIEAQRGPEREAERLGRVEDLSVAMDEGKAEPVGVRIVSPPEEAQRLRDHVILDWDAVDAWFVEDERQRGHPRDPYHRIDVHASSRPVRVSVEGHTLAESDRPMAVFETGLAFRFYLPEVDVHTDLLTQSPTRTRCAYKGEAVYYHADPGEGTGLRVEDAAWSYPSPEPRFGRLQDLVCFHQEKVDMQVAGTQLR